MRFYGTTAHLWYKPLFGYMQKSAVSGDPGGNRTRDNLIKSQVALRHKSITRAIAYYHKAVPQILNHSLLSAADGLGSRLLRGTVYA